MHMNGSNKTAKKWVTANRSQGHRWKNSWTFPPRWRRFFPKPWAWLAEAWYQIPHWCQGTWICDAKASGKRGKCDKVKQGSWKRQLRCHSRSLGCPILELTTHTFLSTVNRNFLDKLFRWWGYVYVIHLRYQRDLAFSNAQVTHHASYQKFSFA